MKPGSPERAADGAEGNADCRHGVKMRAGLPWQRGEYLSCMWYTSSEVTSSPIVEVCVSNLDGNTRGNSASNHLAPFQGFLMFGAPFTQGSGAALLHPVLVYGALSGWIYDRDCCRLDTFRCSTLSDMRPLKGIAQASGFPLNGDSPFLLELTSAG